MRPSVKRIIVIAIAFVIGFVLVQPLPFHSRISKVENGTIFEASDELTSVANIVSGELSTGSEWASIFTPDYIFGYTYACPSVSKTADTTLTNIYNFNNPGDVIPALPLKIWGFTWFGQVCVLPEKDYENLRRRYQMVYNEPYNVSLSTDKWESILAAIAPTQEIFVGNDTIDLATDIISWGLGGKKDHSYNLIDILVEHLDVGEELFRLFKKVKDYDIITLILQNGMSVEGLRNIISYGYNEFARIKGAVNQAVEETKEMSDVDGKDQETHQKYLQWNTWLKNNQALTEEILEKGDIEVRSKEDLLDAQELAEDRSDTYNKIVMTINDLLALFYDTNGDLIAGFTQGHNKETYKMWVNSSHYGYLGWFCNSEVEEIDMNKSSQQTYVGDYCFDGCINLKNLLLPDGIFVGLGKVLEFLNQIAG